MSSEELDSAKLRMGIALRAAFQSEAWLGAHAGIFTRLGIDLTFPAIATGGPASMVFQLAGLWAVIHLADGAVSAKC